MWQAILGRLVGIVLDWLYKLIKREYTKRKKIVAATKPQEKVDIENIKKLNEAETKIRRIEIAQDLLNGRRNI